MNPSTSSSSSQPPPTATLRFIDLVVLIVSLLLLLISLYSTSSIDILPTQFLQQLGPPYQNRIAPSPSERPPIPVVTDLDGDYNNEIIIGTRDNMIRIYHADSQGTLKLSRSTTIANPSSASSPYLSRRDGVNGFILKIGTGYVDEYNVSSSSPRSQILIVVTSTLMVYCYDSQLSLKWTHDIGNDLYEGTDSKRRVSSSSSYLTDISILITSHHQQHGDRGMIIVGGRMRPRIDIQQYHQHGARLEKKAMRKPTTVGGVNVKNPVTGEVEVIHTDDTDGDDTADDSGAEFTADYFDPDASESLLNDGSEHHFGDTSHYNYWCFNGATGDTRWKHQGNEFVLDDPTANILRPQHQVHSGEIDWRNYRMGVLNSLPHVWGQGGDDNKMELKRFNRNIHKHKDGGLVVVNDIKDTKTTKKKKKKDVPTTTSTSSILIDQLGITTPSSISSSLPTPTSLPAFLQPHTNDEHIPHPNVIVSHIREGIEILHLYTGRPLTQLPLKPYLAHVDINGDGIIDHVDSLSHHQIDKESTVLSPFMSKKIHLGEPVDSISTQKGPNCFLRVTSGTPHTRPLFNDSLCQRGLGILLGGNTFSTINEKIQRELSRKTAELEASLFTPPLVIPTLSSVQQASLSRLDIQEGPATSRLTYQILIFTSEGMVISYNPDGTRGWILSTDSYWNNGKSKKQRAMAVGANKAIRGFLTSSGSGGVGDIYRSQLVAQLSFIPSMTAFGLYGDDKYNGYRYDEYDAISVQYIVVVGENEMTIVDTVNQYVVGHIGIYDTSLHQPVVGDVNNDGINDIILTTVMGYHVFVIHQRVGNSIMIGLTLGVLICIVVVMGIRISREGMMKGMISKWRMKEGSGGSSGKNGLMNEVYKNKRIAMQLDNLKYM